jgi:hypothetical protein
MYMYSFHILTAHSSLITSATKNFLTFTLVLNMCKGLNYGSGSEFFFATTSRLALGPTQPPIQWVPGAFPGSKGAKA